MANPTKSDFLALQQAAMAAAISTNSGPISDNEIALATAAGIAATNNIQPANRKLKGRHVIDSTVTISYEA